MIEKRLLTGNEVDIVFFIKPHQYPDTFEINTKFVSPTRFQVSVTRKDKDTGWAVPLELSGRLPDGQTIFIRVGPSQTNTKVLENDTELSVRKIRKTLKGDIPKRVFQVSQDNVPDYILTKSICSWKQIHHDHEYYLAEQDSSDLLQPYKLIHKYGGMYCASPNICKSLIASKITTGKNGVVVYRDDKKSFRTDFFMFTAKHPLLNDFLHTVEGSSDNTFISTNWNKMVSRYLSQRSSTLQAIPEKVFLSKLVHVFSPKQFLPENKPDNKEKKENNEPLEVYESPEETKPIIESKPKKKLVSDEVEESLLEELVAVGDEDDLDTREENEEEELEEVEIEIVVEVDEDGNEIQEVAFSETDAQQTILGEQKSLGQMEESTPSTASTPI